MLDLLTRLLLFRQARERSLAATIRRVLPVERTGVYLVLSDSSGLCIDSLSQAGLILVSSEVPPKLKGGRGVWPEFTAAADNAMQAQRLDALRFALRGDSIEVCTAQARLVTTATPAGDVVLVLETVDGAPRTLPPAVAVRVPSEDQFRDDVTPWIGTLAGWLEQTSLRSEDEASITLEVAMPGLSRRQKRGLLDLAANAVSRSLCLRASAGDLTPLLEHAALVDRQHRAHALLQRRRQAVETQLRRERDRVARAQRALAREEASAPEAEWLRRQADALLSAPRDAIRFEPGAVSVPDPYDAEVRISVPSDPPGAAIPQLAEKLYARAKKAERGRVVRATRQASMAARGLRLTVLCAAAERASDLESVAALEAELMRLGVAAGEAAGASRGSTKQRHAGAEQGPARVFRSPGGFDVLVGRSARQNDQLTFKLAAPEDYWFHVKAYPGAHVVLRLAGRREAEPADLRFAAQLAAAHSQAPKGEAVDVHIVRRKHLGRPKGGKAGQVLIKKRGAILRVVGATGAWEPV